MNTNFYSPWFSPTVNRKPASTVSVADALSTRPPIGFNFQIPDREVANIFSNHYIYQWAVESLSLLVAASLTEDDYGFVQQRISEVLVALLDLLAVRI